MTVFVMLITPRPLNGLLVNCEAGALSKWKSLYMVGRESYWCTSSTFTGRVGQFTGGVGYLVFKLANSYFIFFVAFNSTIDIPLICCCHGNGVKN